MINFQQLKRRFAVTGALAVCLLVVWSFRVLPWAESETWQSAKDSLSGLTNTNFPTNNDQDIIPSLNWTGRTLPLHVENYFEQAFAVRHPAPFNYTALKDHCDHVQWNEDDIYMKCGGMAAGLTSIVSQVKVCLKMAIESGSHLVLPAMPLRDSKNLQEFNFLNGDAYLTYDKWFDVDHLREQMGKACPKMKIIHPDELDKKVPVKYKWRISCHNAPQYQPIHGYFWAGRTYKSFHDGQYRELVEKTATTPASEETGKPKKGITLIETDSMFLLFKITDDPTRRDMRLWNDLSHIVRFREEPRQIIHQLRKKLTRPYYGVHFRVENDTIWSSLDNQLKRDLDALDRAWSLYGKPGEDKPLVYLACGDKVQVEKFVAAGAERGWEVTHKWRLTENDPKTKKRIDNLAFDFQGAIDMGIMVRSEFFMGITGSAFSSTIANQRDILGRYRGSSFDVVDDEGARSHLFNDLDADQYACCL